MQKLKPIKWATATAKWDEISANCHKHRNGENQKKWDISQLWWRFNPGLCHVRCWIKKEAMWNISRVPLILAPIDMQLLLSLSFYNMHLDFTAIPNFKVHSVTCTHFSSPQCKSTPFQCGVKRRERHVSWLVGLGVRHDSQQGSDIPKPQEPRGATTSSTLAGLRPTLVCHSELVDPTPLENMVDFA